MALSGPKVVTELPGPKSRELLKVMEENVPKAITSAAPVFIKRGEGALFEDVDGNVFIDFAGGISILNVGYSHPEVVQAVKEQADKFFHSQINCVPNEPYIRLAEKLNAVIPGNFKKKTLFVNSGAEAVENAVKIARKFTKRTEIITFTGAFHGRTLLTMTLTSKVKPYKFGFGPFAPGIHRIPFPYCYRCPYGQERQSCDLFCVKCFEDFFIEEVAPEEVAAILIEPIQGEAGFVIPPDEFCKELRNICDKYGILLIVDEIQTGFCRTGKMFATNYWDVYPDIVTTAKSIAAGIPLAAITARADIADSVHGGGIGGTFGGSPLAAVAGLKVIEIMQRDNFADKANQIGKICMGRMDQWKEKYSIVGDVRGRGAMVAIEFVKDKKTKEPAKEEVSKIQRFCWEHGLVVLKTGIRDNVIRLLTPLVIAESQLQAGLDILEKAIAQA
ncbi:MAG TPA: 4-aminobutyrate--2-oxoglutarate transaminase [Synergistaceae bacterium]|nr:4-aminobutyrate--2-oxoglutarate transaminase [Synergistaceae bacterium]